MIAIFWITILGIAACSEIPEKNLIYLSGRVELDSDAMDGRPAFVTILKSTTIEAMNNMADIPADAVVDLLEVSKSNYSFTIELSEKGFLEGDTITLFAFTDKNYSQGIPFPNQGDIIGMYYDDTDGMPSTAYTLKNGLNEGILIKINREIF